MKSVSKIIIILLIFIQHSYIHAQTWERIYGYPNRAEYVTASIHSYDQGSVLLQHIDNRQIWLYKIDINGTILWEKYLQHPNDEILICRSMVQSYSGNNLLLSGQSNQTDPEGDPVIFFIDECYEFAWCKIWSTPEMNYGFQLLSVPSGGYIWHTRYGSPTGQGGKERIQLIKLNNNGDFEWINQVAPTYEYPKIFNHDMQSIINTTDGGFLMGGYGYHIDTANPELGWVRNMMIKCDSSGNEEWVRAFFKQDDAVDIGGTIGGVFELNGFYYGGATHYLGPGPIASVPFFLKVDTNGEVLDYNYLFGDTLFFSQPIEFDIINDSSILVLTTTTRYISEYTHIALLVSDTNANVKKSFDSYSGFPVSQCLSKSEDGKYLITGGTDEREAYFDGYAMKVNANLEWDSLYNASYTYDSLCPDTIPSSVIECTCDITTGINKNKQNSMRVKMNVFPNPASSEVVVDLPKNMHGTLLSVTDLFGRKIFESPVTLQNMHFTIQINNWQEGFYLVNLINKNEIIATEKLLITKVSDLITV